MLEIRGRKPEASRRVQTESDHERKERRGEREGEPRNRESREPREHVVEMAGLHKEREAREREAMLVSWRRLGYGHVQKS